MVALYPSPAGAVESLLPLDAWNEIVQENPVLSQLQPDIEALLVNRVGHAHELSRAEYYIAPIDECYRLVGLIRANWKGLSGGSEVWAEIGRFFSELRSQADVVNGKQCLKIETNEVRKRKEMCRGSGTVRNYREWNVTRILFTCLGAWP